MLLGARTGSTNMPTVVGGGFGPPTMPSHDVNAAGYAPSQQPTNMQLYKSYCAVNGIDPSGWVVDQAGNPAAVQIPGPTMEERCFDSFYYHFHASHPFVLPKPFLLQISKEPSLNPVTAAMRWVGSIFIDVATPVRERMFNEAFSLIYAPGRSKDGFLVQAMMLLIVGLDGSCQQDKARGILNDVEALALEIRLNTREFATTHGRGIAVLEESWRRTWWDLFVIDGMVAGVHRVTNFLLFDVPAGAALPCEEDQYLTAVSVTVEVCHFCRDETNGTYAENTHPAISGRP